ncbi:MAG: biotin-dependent carboxyltransferase family protein [Anaerolineales bacterium]|nr:biotin-dependent carboxyltransferase family protein [Anaerolineales bacterium]
MLEILEVSGIATLQDSGRRGWNKFGVPTSGLMDWFASQTANSLLNNPPNSAVIELGLGEITLHALRNTVLAVTGAGYEVENYIWTFPLWTSFYVRAGWTVRMKKTSGGNWAYIAIAGGFDSPVIMNSRSTYLRGGIGSALKAGDVLHSFPPTTDLLKLAARDFPVDKFMPYSQSPTLEVIPAPQADWFTPEGVRTFYESEYTLSPSFDRMGYRLQGSPIEKAISKELISEGMTLGSIQIPDDGQPIVMMADAPTAGGYPKIANVTRASLPLLAQCEAGVSKICFREVTVEEAQLTYSVIARVLARSNLMS